MKTRNKCGRIGKRPRLQVETRSVAVNKNSTRLLENLNLYILGWVSSITARVSTARRYINRTAARQHRESPGLEIAMGDFLRELLTLNF